MKTLPTILTSLLLVFAIQTVSYAQSVNITETFKKHFNETVLDVQATDNSVEKRAILNKSLSKMINTIETIEKRATLTDIEIADLQTYKLGLVDKQSELNGLDGFDRVLDNDLDDFSNYSQNFIEQANRTVTIGVTTALLILIILLLL